MKSGCVDLIPVGYVPSDAVGIKADTVRILAAAWWRPRLGGSGAGFVGFLTPRSGIWNALVYPLSPGCLGSALPVLDFAFSPAGTRNVVRCPLCTFIGLSQHQPDLQKPPLVPDCAVLRSAPGPHSAAAPGGATSESLPLGIPT